MRLMPLRQVESFLIAKLVPANEEQPALYSRQFLSDQPDVDEVFKDKEVFVRPGTGWKGKLARSNKSSGSAGSGSSASTGGTLRDEPQEMLNALRHDIMQLWNDRLVRDILRRRKIRLEEFPGL
jgi:guanine nucleotide-binding protein subunit alpha